MEFRSGKGGTVTIDGDELPVDTWRVNPTAQIVMFKNSKTGNIPRREATFSDATVDVTLDYDFDANPFADPSNIIIGTTLENVKLYLNGGTAGTQFWSFTSLVVSTTPQSLNVDGKIQTSFTAAVNGDFAYPGGTVIGT